MSESTVSAGLHPKYELKMGPTGVVELPASRYNLDTYFGRVRVSHIPTIALTFSIAWI